MINHAEIRLKMTDGAAVLYPGPYLNQLRGESIENRCRDLLACGIKHLIINFEETELINSIGISILLGVIETVRNAEGRLLLSNLSSSNRDLFDVLGLLPRLHIETTEEQALAKASPRIGN